MTLLKASPLKGWLLFLGVCCVLSGCSPARVDAIAEGVTEGVIHKIEEHNTTVVD